MTETDWLACSDPGPMLTFLQGRGNVSERKFRLLSVACCRIIRHHMRRRASRTAVDVAERYADGEAEEAEVVAAWQTVTSYKLPGPGDLVRMLFEPREARGAAGWALSRPTYPELVVEQVLRVQRTNTLGTAAERCCTLIREVVGPLPFRRVGCDPDWLTDTVVALARGIYEERAFDRLPLLVDALMDAGCADEDVLGHGRSTGPSRSRVLRDRLGARQNVSREVIVTESCLRLAPAR